MCSFTQIFYGGPFQDVCNFPFLFYIMKNLVCIVFYCICKKNIDMKQERRSFFYDYSSAVFVLDFLSEV